MWKKAAASGGDGMGKRNGGGLVFHGVHRKLASFAPLGGAMNWGGE